MAKAESTQSNPNSGGTDRHLDTQREDARGHAVGWCKGVFKGRICDDSMECDDAEKSLPANATITFDDSIKPVSGDVVIAKVRGGLIVRELVKADGGIFLRARSGAYPDLSIESTACVIAKGVFMDVSHQLKGANHG